MAKHTVALSEQEWSLLRHDLALSPRQTEIARLISQGMSDKQIAWQLGISFGTLRTHLGRLFQKCDVNDRLELLAHIYATLHRSWQDHALVSAQSGDDVSSSDSLWTHA